MSQNRDFEELRHVFDRRGWQYVQPPEQETIVTRFGDSHGPVMLVLKFAEPGELAITAYGVARVSRSEMQAVMAALGAPPDGPKWGRDPGDDEVWAEWRVRTPSDWQFETVVVGAIDQFMLLIDAWRTRRLVLQQEDVPRAATIPGTAGRRPIVALSTTDEQALFQFVRTASLVEAREILEAHPGLLTDVADDKVRRMIDDQLTPQARRLVAEKRTLLRRARDLGIPAAFGG